MKVNSKVKSSFFSFITETIFSFSKKLTPEEVDAPTKPLVNQDTIAKVEKMTGCSNNWTIKKMNQAFGKRLEIAVDFQQNFDGTYNKTTCTIGVVRLQRKNKWGFWVKATADSITIEGAFAGPRSPLDVNGNYGYLYPNPFLKNYSSEVIHFKDYSLPNLPCYSMTTAVYTISASFSGGGVTTTVQW